MGQILNVILILVFTAVIALLTSIFAYLFDQLMTTSALRHVSQLLTDLSVTGEMQYPDLSIANPV
jgi:hypothetical protein